MKSNPTRHNHEKEIKINKMKKNYPIDTYLGSLGGV